MKATKKTLSKTMMGDFTPGKVISTVWSVWNIGIWTSRRVQPKFQHVFRAYLRLSSAAMMIALGQHTRAGIEENLWDTSKGKRLTTVQMIEKHVRIANELGRKIASGDEARSILKIGVTYDTVEETLQNLGLPPNRHAGQTGFIGYPATDGKLRTAQPAGSDGHPLVGETVLEREKVAK